MQHSNFGLSVAGQAWRFLNFLDNDINSNPISSLDIYQGYDKKIQSALCEQYEQISFCCSILYKNCCAYLVELSFSTVRFLV